MTPTMSCPWPEIRQRYAEAPDFAWTGGMLALVDHLSRTSLHAWTSMFDLCVTRSPVAYPYEGPVVRVCPVADTALLALQWPDDRVHFVAASDAVTLFQRLAHQFSWLPARGHGA